MRLRNTLTALAILLVVGGYAFVVRFYSKPVEARKALRVKPGEIAKIDLKYPGRELVLERKPGAPWMISQPLGVKADQAAANNLARAIADCRITGTVEQNPKDLAPFGLARPQVIVTVTTMDHRTLPAIEVGRTTPIGFSAYVKLTAEPAVMLTSSAFHAEMNKTPGQMRDRELMTFKADDVKRLTIEHDNGPAVEVDRDRGQWNIVKPARYPADSTQVHQLLSALAQAKAADFVSDAPADVASYGLEKPRLTITVYTGKTGKAGGGRESLRFGARRQESGKDEVYVRRGERAPIYTVPQWVLSSVDKPVLELRDKTALGLEPSKVETAEVRSNGKEFTLKRAGGKWSLVEDGKTSEADTAAVEVFLNRIRDLKGASIVMDPVKDPDVLGMNKPALVFKFAGQDGKPLGEVKLFKVENGNPPPGASPEPSGAGADYYLTSSTSTALFSTDQSTFHQLAKPAGQFRPRSHPIAAASPPPGH